MSTTRPIRFFHQGAVREVSDAAPTRSVLDWLRDDARCTGTKEGCNEGDCGACTVIVAEPDSGAPGGLRLRNMNACLMFLPTLDGKALLTVEDVSALNSGALHPAQQALVDCHGSQCGFCTPGFVMSLTALYEDHCARGTRPDRQELADALAGNLCRCTGYRPILDAGERMFDGAQQRIEAAPIVAALDQLAASGPLHYAAPNPAFRAADGAPRIDHFHAPRSLDEFAALRAALPAARLLAGATDIGLWVNKQGRDLGNILFIGEVAELKRIEVQNGLLIIGAAASLEDAWRALADQVPGLTEMWRRFASPPVRHAGTLGGNLANGSPIGDGAPVLMALGARLVLRHGEAEREVPLDAFYLDYMKSQLAPGEFIARILVPLPDAGTTLRFWKIAKRYDSDISAVCGAFALRLQDGVVAGARLAYGGLAATVRRAAQAEAALVGQPWTHATVEAAVAALAKDFQPLSDLRASAAYRSRIAGQLLRRLWLETRTEAPLPAATTSVWEHAAATPQEVA
ncbi:MAG: xanthine dehydrogenase small subunit [Burkholderiales bacterium]